MKRTFCLFLFFQFWVIQMNAQFAFHLAFEECLGGVANNAMVGSISVSRNRLLIADNSIYVNFDVRTDSTWQIPFKSSSNDYDSYIKKLDSNGNTLWESVFGSTEAEGNSMLFNKGNAELDLTFVSAGRDSDIVCYYLDTTRQDTTNVSAHTFRLDGNGSILSKKCYGSHFRSAQMFECLPTSDHGYLITSRCKDFGIPPSNSNLSVLIKCDSMMNQVWHYCLDTAARYQLYEVENGNYLLHARTSGKNFFGAPTRNNDAGLVKFSASGSLIWAKAFGSQGLEEMWNLLVENGSYTLIGYSGIQIPIADSGDVHGHHGGNDIWIIKIDTTGNLLNQRCIGNTGNDFGSDIIARPGGGYYISGITDANIIAGDSLFNHGQDDCLIVELDSNLNYVDGICIGGSGIDNVVNIKLHPDQSIWGYGRTNSSDGDVSFNHGSMDHWVFRLAPDSTLSVQSKSNELAGFNLYPNPAKDELNLSFQSAVVPLSIDLFTLQGMQLLHEEGINKQHRVSLRAIPNGVYLLHCAFSNGTVLYRKVVVLH